MEEVGSDIVPDLEEQNMYSHTHAPTCTHTYTCTLDIGENICEIPKEKKITQKYCQGSKETIL